MSCVCFCGNFILLRFLITSARAHDLFRTNGGIGVIGIAAIASYLFLVVKLTYDTHEFRSIIFFSCVFVIVLFAAHAKYANALKSNQIVALRERV